MSNDHLKENKITIPTSTHDSKETRINENVITQGIASTKNSVTLQQQDKAILVAMEMPDTDLVDISEFEELVASAGVHSMQLVTGKRKAPDKRLYIGSGKADEVKLAMTTFDANVVIFNHTLYPSQARNLEALFGCRVIDRTGLILDIFAQRAQSFEGKLQVELAQLKHLSTRLVRMWTHLERQKGGIGLRGPGETQLESDKRMIMTRISQIQKKLDKVEETRKQGRVARQKSDIPTIALVGYTNSGKSTLFNLLTQSKVYAADQLFATLDPTHRALKLAQTGEAILVDTVGFISRLPHELIAAFKSTLQESVEADLLLEIVDCADPESVYKAREVGKVLDEIGAGNVPKIQVFNKIDLLENVEPHVLKNDIGEVVSVWVSAHKEQGLDALLSAISTRFQETHVKARLVLSPQYGKLRAQLFEIDAVIQELIDEEGRFILDIYVAKRHLNHLATKNPENAALLAPFLNSMRVIEAWE